MRFFEAFFPLEQSTSLTNHPLPTTQNNLHELWVLLNHIYPDVFTTSAVFDKAFNLTQHLVNDDLLEKAHKLLQKLSLRRIKSEVSLAAWSECLLRHKVGEGYPICFYLARRMLTHGIEKLNWAACSEEAVKLLQKLWRRRIKGKVRLADQFEVVLRLKLLVHDTLLPFNLGKFSAKFET